MNGRSCFRLLGEQTEDLFPTTAGSPFKILRWVSPPRNSTGSIPTVWIGQKTVQPFKTGLDSHNPDERIGALVGSLTAIRNDSRAQIPIGGRLTMFVNQWRDTTIDAWAL